MKKTAKFQTLIKRQIEGLSESIWIYHLTMSHVGQPCTRYITHLPGTTAKVRLQLLEPISFVDVHTKNPDVSLEMLKRDNTPSSAE